MQFRITTLLIITACFAALWLTPLPAQCETVQFVTEQFPPLAYTKNGKLEGYNIDLLKAVCKKMNVPSYNIRIQPFPRSIKHFNSRVPTCLFPIALTMNRRAKHRYAPSSASFQVGILTHKKYTKEFADKKKIHNSRISIGKSSSTVRILRRYGFSQKSFEYGTTLPCIVKKFAKGRTHLIAGDIASIKYNYKLVGGDPSDLVVLKKLSELQNGFIFNNAVSQNFVYAFQQTLSELINSKEGKRIYNKHFAFKKSKT
ncbi:substrate-binding periplasmic protein [Halodesulfovibrio spirochaetisodalis]|uniref:Solute-binding protein family 3/N-terminal domain-containing protein n=1 Tax=Halodesulfovibrio spirochaetisodalis TaxID=1560234 RepID=A0A1B7XPR5_9BACT|nr:transporter substrate-binding domain-containing protein [Halodesulfovibrio spirochaetisodalis]OBQ57507.1 hypothetical protein SP90_00190 [Halodesulfovibrio spirochaetisodalis]